jgi:adenine-specific DNA-methyltransferase
MQLNSEDGGNRKFICVQLPEATPPDSEARKAGYKTIADIAKERIRRAGAKIKSEIKEDLFTKEGKSLDIGFRVFKLDSSNIKAWDGDVKDFQQNLLSASENIKTNRTEEDVLYEILLKSGLDLAQPIEEKTIAGKKVFNIGVGALFICLADDLNTDVAEGIGKWKQELEPAICRVIFKDTGFTDVEKTNSIQILKRYGITEVNTI